MGDDTRRLFEHTATLAADFLESVPERYVGPRISAAELRDALAGPFPERGLNGPAILDDLEGHVERGIVASTGPRFFGFVVGGALPPAIAADWLTNTWDQNAGLFVLSPLASVVEEVAAQWLLEIFGLPTSASVGFVTGGQMANFTALSAARHGILRKAGWNVEEQGLAGAPRVRIIAGGEAHVTIYSSLRMLGFGTKLVEIAEADEQGRMKPESLRELLERGPGEPAIVCAQIGNVNSGAFDPLREIAAITRDHGAWLHVDGAFGLWAAADPERRHLLDGVSWPTPGRPTHTSGSMFLRTAVSSWSPTAPHIVQP